MSKIVKEEIESRAVSKKNRRANKSSEDPSRKVTIVGALVNILLFFLKLWAGIAGKSQAMIADAIHSLADLVTDAIVYYGLYMGEQQADDDHHFGHGRYETFATFLVGTILMLTAFFIGYEAIESLITEQTSQISTMTLAAALLSIVAKELLFQWNMQVGKKFQHQLLIVNAWHHRSDALSSIAVFVGLLAGYIDPKWAKLDSVAAIIVALMILKMAYDNMRSSFAEIVDTAPAEEINTEIQVCIQKISGVEAFHDLKLRSVGGQIFCQVHIEVNGDLTVREGHTISEAVEHALLALREDIGDAIVHVDPFEES